MRIIGFAGLAGAGKDTCASLIHGAQRRAFADPLKQAAMQMLGFTHEQVYGREREVPDPRYGNTPRAALQLLGTEFGRAFCPTLWVDKWHASLPADGIVTVTDVRFPNEVQAIRNLRGIVLWVSRAGLTPMGHASENAIGPDDCHAVIAPGVLETLRDRLSTALAAAGLPYVLLRAAD